MPNSTRASASSRAPTATADLRALKLEKLRRLELRNERFADFIPKTSPEFKTPKHLGPLLSLFERVARGEPVRACVSVPPQHGKTEGLLHGIAWLLRRDPTQSYAYATYQQDQSNDKSDRCRALTQRAGAALSPTRATLLQWRTTAGGGCMFTSIGGPLTGQNGRVIIFDDPYKNRDAALSEATRRAVWSFFQSAVLTRGQEGMSVIVVHTRWVEDDLIGKLSQRGGWEVLNLPFLMREDGSPATRDGGYADAVQVLNPRDESGFGWTLEGARRHLIDLDEAVAEALYQGRPRRRVDGALWSWENLTPWRVEVEPPRSTCSVYVDPNQASEAAAATADNAGIVTVARGIDGRAYVLDDASGYVGVDTWTERAVAAYRKHKAHSICIEADGGGELNRKAIEAYLLGEALERSKRERRHVDPERILIRLVRVGARGDKRGRAETARTLYGDPKAGRPSMVSHVGYHDHLEQSLTSHDFATTSKSPGAIDALSLGLADLLLSRHATAPARTTILRTERTAGW
jgi:hypothetical protein